MNSGNFVNDRILEAINNREDLAALLNDLFQHRNSCRDLIGPAIGSVINMYQVARDGGANVSQSDAEMNEFLSGSFSRMAFELTRSFNVDPELAGRQLSSLVSGINTARSHGTTWFVPSSRANPIPVAVMSMVDRATKTELKRDDKGAITGSMQVESDLEP